MASLNLTSPMFLLPGGIAPQDLVQSLNLFTSLETIILTGFLPPSVVDVQIRINGGAFFSDPSLVFFDGESFTIPDLSVFPEGLPLEVGTTSLDIRSVDSLGNVSSVASATLQRTSRANLNLVVEAPTGLAVKRSIDNVELSWAQNPPPSIPGSNIIGYNVYASTISGSGYLRVNRDLITTPYETRELSLLLDSNTFNFDPTFSGGSPLRQTYTELDPTNNNPVATPDDRIIDLSTQVDGDFVRVTTSINSVTVLPYYRFTHKRTATVNEGTLNSDIFSINPPDSPLYYVVTAVAANPSTAELTESPFSVELNGSPLAITTEFVDLPLRNRQDITQSYISNILARNNEVSVIPGSYVRDIFIEPFSSEGERLYFVQDFIERCQSFLTLLRLDDLNDDGVSDPVATSPYKRALGIALGVTSESTIQALIDDRFDRLASNYNVTRQGSLAAVGSIIFATTVEPTADVIFPAGTLISTTNLNPAQNFATTEAVTFPFAQRSSFFNFREKRWEIEAPIEALIAGEAGNVSAGRIGRLIGGPSGWRAFNSEPTVFGRDEESNRSLSERAILALSSVDAGTASGYLSTALGTPGVSRATVVKSGDRLMQRDYDDVRNKHIGGKVDVWIQGNRPRTITETFALSVNIGRQGLFILDGPPSQLTFVIDDSRLTPDNPLISLLGATPQEIAQGFGLRNLTNGQSFNVTNAVVLDFNRVRLDNTLPQPSFSVADVIRGDYRYQSLTSYLPRVQPISSVSSIVNSSTGAALTEGTDWQLNQSQDPLLEGRSSIAQDLIQFLGGFTTGSPIAETGETLVLVGEDPANLNFLGVDPITIRVFNLDRTVEYIGPFTGSLTPDFFVTTGDSNTPTAIFRNNSGSIVSGQEVLVDYSHEENLVLTYSSNSLVSTVQNEVDIKSHVTADVIVKAAVPLPVDLSMTVSLKKNSVRSLVDSNLRTALGRFFNTSPVGSPIYQSDVIRVIEEVEGVDFVVVPFARMALTDGALVVRESISNASTFIFSGPASQTYILNDSFSAATIDGGGSPLQPLGVYLNTQPMSFVGSLLDVNLGPGRAYILGASGRSILGFSDDATLTAQGFNTPEERDAQRKALTANKAVISLPLGESPINYSFDVTYQAFNDPGSRDIQPSEVSYLELGNLTIVYRER